MNGLRIKRRRKEVGLSAQDVAKFLRTTRGTIFRWEAGQNDPSDATKFELAKLLKTSVAYLMGETDNPDPDFSTVLGKIVYEDKKEQEIKPKNDTLEEESYAYWGGMLDKARRAATRGNEKEISLIRMFLKSAYEMLGIEEKSSTNNKIDMSNWHNEGSTVIGAVQGVTA